MNLSLLQVILIGSSMVLLYIIIDARRRRKLRIFHALVFIWSLSSILFVSLYPNILERVAAIVGVSKWSDFLVYMSIIFLVFMFFSLLQNLIQQQQELTRLCTAQALREYYITNQASQYTVQNEWDKAKYLFLIRAYNEWSVLKEVIEEIIQYWFSKIIIVDDGSKDNTAEVIDEIRKLHHDSAIIWLYHPINRGPWAANKTLFAFATKYATWLWCERCVTYDADGQMSIKDMDVFIQQSKKQHYDIIIGSRFVQWASTHNMPLFRKLILLWARIITYIFNGLWITDVSTGYRMYHVDSISKIKLISDWFSYQNDIIESIHSNNLSFIEIPVHIKYTAYSLHKGQNNSSAIKILIRLIYSSLFHR